MRGENTVSCITNALQRGLTIENIYQQRERTVIFLDYLCVPSSDKSIILLNPPPPLLWYKLPSIVACMM